MKQLIYVFSLSFLFACSNDVQKKSIADTATPNDSVPSHDTASTAAAAIPTSNPDISPRFLLFAKYLDSAGFGCDTLRLKKTYNALNKQIRIADGHYFFYKYRPHETALDWYFEMIKSDSALQDKATALDETLFRKANRVVTYFFTEKKPVIFHSPNWYVDGLVYEWQFPDSGLAKSAADEFTEKNEVIYFNVGSYVCNVDNYLYVFTSRASGSMSPIRDLYKQFLKMNGVEVKKQ